MRFFFFFFSFFFLLCFCSLAQVLGFFVGCLFTVLYYQVFFLHTCRFPNPCNKKETARNRLQIALLFTTLASFFRNPQLDKNHPPKGNKKRTAQQPPCCNVDQCRKNARKKKERKKKKKKKNWRQCSQLTQSTLASQLHKTKTPGTTEELKRISFPQQPMALSQS